MKQDDKEKDNREKVKNTDDWEKLAQEYLDGWKRERAAFENYRKEETARFEALQVFLKRKFLTNLLPILDSFELALKSTPEEAQKSDWFTGYTYIKKQFEDLLKEEGIEVIETQSKEFNPYLHEAIETHQDAKESDGPLIILEELQRGYRLGNTVLRPARVRVGRKRGDEK